MTKFCRAVSCLIVIAAVFFPASAADAQVQVAQERKNLLLDAKTWGYQLRNLGASQQRKIAASPYDVVIIDIENIGDKTTRLTRAEVNGMKKKRDGSRRLVMAYLSIGEAESYRSYWKPAWRKAKPDWVNKENEEWKDNYLVKYWDPTWQSILFGSPAALADRILAAGFDGFYLDRVDAYYYFGDTPELRTQMVDLVAKLAIYIRARKPDAMILGQNAEELLEDATYLSAVDGIAKESLYYGIPGPDKINPDDDLTHSGGLLAQARKAGKAVYCVEYLRNPANIADAKKRMDENGFVLYVANRGLAELNPSPHAVPPSTRDKGVVKQFENTGLPTVKATAPN
jgi:cysteinyl-tRNA synthetase, unknown class